MADFSIERAARRGFGGLFSAKGRDDRMQFWIFCALVFGPLIAVQFIAQIVLTIPSFDMIVAAPPDDPGAARRLHDRDRSGWWALILPPGLFTVAQGQARQMSEKG